MLPNISRRNGSSFRGAGAYHLHDKANDNTPRPRTSERVAWTATRNLANDDPALAIDEMWYSAESASQLKRMSGRRQSGNKCTEPVKTVSLSWAPHQSPTREQMEAAADSFLKAMGWQDHQALLICHVDTAHPHLHIILNRIHADTGMVLNDWRDWQRSQRWADGYDREQGQILCHARADKYEKQCFDLQLDGMPYPYAKLMQEQTRAFDSSMAFDAVQDKTEKDTLAEQHRQEREAFLTSGKAQFRQARQEAYRQVRDEFKPHWREHFAHDRDLHRRLDQRLRIASLDAMHFARQGDHAAADARLVDVFDQQDDALQDLATGRKDLRQLQLETTRDRQDEACRSLIELRAAAFQLIKDRQKEERAELKALQSARDAGQPHDMDRLQELVGQTSPAAAANDNRSPDELLESAQRNDRKSSFHPDALPRDSGSPLFRSVLAGSPTERGPRRLVTDSIAGAISLGISLLEGLAESSSPLERAQAKARAIRREQEAPAIAAELREQKLRDDFTRHALTAVREAQAEHDRGRKLDHEARDRRRQRER